MITLQTLSNLRGRRALITGATGYLGGTMAETLAELGADLLLVDREEANFVKLCDALKRAWGIRVEYLVCNLELEKERNRLVDHVKKSGDHLNILINNAAFVGTSKLEGWSVPFEYQSIQTWRRALEVNLVAVFDLCQRFAPLLKSAEGGSIINVASIYGLCGPDWQLYEDTDMGNPAAYGASKAGVIQLTRWLATTISPEIRVNSISPGGILRGQDRVFIDRYAQKTPLGRMATEDDFRGITAYLASDLSRYVTGQNIVIDGGRGCL